MLIFTGLILLVALIMQPLQILHFRDSVAVLFPKGMIALEERDLLFTVQFLMLLIIVPVYILTFVFSWKYRADNAKAKYDPDLVDNQLAEYIWWMVPLVMVGIISGLIWVKTHELDPYKSIKSNSNNKEMTIQVVALQWRWLFIYPEEKIATINFIQIPKDTPIRFELTADAPMNSFWIPQLGGQIYAMPKMKTELNLIANEVGDFRGVSSNISGEGFAKMIFITRASSVEEYNQWVKTAQQSPKSLGFKEYNQLVAPSQNTAVEIFQLGEEKLFDHVVNKYMHPKKDE